MEKEDLKFIKFRSELIHLLEKYRYELSGSGFDDGSMDIVDIKNKKRFVLKDVTSDYGALKENDLSLIEVSFDYIIDMFSGDVPKWSSEIARVGIFTNNYLKAKHLFENIFENNKINIEKYINGENHKEITLKNGTRYTWIKVNESNRGCRCSQAYVDRNLTLKELQTIVMPICIYCEKENVKII